MKYVGWQAGFIVSATVLTLALLAMSVFFSSYIVPAGGAWGRDPLPSLNYIGMSLPLVCLWAAIALMSHFSSLTYAEEPIHLVLRRVLFYWFLIVAGSVALEFALVIGWNYPGVVIEKGFPGISIGYFPLARLTKLILLRFL